MKGFLYLVEIAVAAVLAILILGSFFVAQTVETTWDRADLIGYGNNIFDVLGNDSVRVLNESDYHYTIDKLMPSNVKYSIRFKGIPKDVIKVGTNNINTVKHFLDDSYVNNRWIKYELTEFDSGDSFDEFDVLVLYDYDYTGNKLSKLETFSETKPVIGIEDSSTGFASFYNLTYVGSVTSVNGLEFNKYDNYAKYFLGIGFIVNTGNIVDIGGAEYWWGCWKIKENNKVITLGPNGIYYVDGECSSGNTNVPNTQDREKFGGDNNYFLKKASWIDMPKTAYISIKDTNFQFASTWLSSTNGYQAGSQNEIIGNDYCSAMAKSANKIWIYQHSDNVAVLSSEYYTLVQAAVASSVTDWYTSELKTNEFTEVSRFIPLCCDMTEIAEMSFSMWYVF